MKKITGWVQVSKCNHCANVCCDDCDNDCANDCGNYCGPHIPLRNFFPFVQSLFSEILCACMTDHYKIIYGNGICRPQL